MTKKAMAALLDAGTEFNIRIGSRDEYCGRGMSKTTCAVVANSFSDVFALIAHAVRITPPDDDGEGDDVVDDFVGLRADSMGKGVVIY